LISPFGQEEIKRGTVGAVQPKLPLKNVLDINVKYPAIAEQRKIVEILKNVDEKISINERINNNLEQQIEALLLELINDDNTSEVALGDYLYIKGRIGWKGLKKSEYLSKSGYRIINGETLTKSGIDWNKAGYISAERYEESPEIMLKVSDILLSKDGTIGKIGYVDSLDLPTSVASGIFVIRNNQPNIISTTFIYYLLKSQLFKAFIVARTEGSVIPHLYQKDFMEFKFPLPAPDKKMTFEEIAEPMFSQIISNLNENKKLTSLRDVILPKLMSGELDVSDIDL
jgi:restriction endonuclease S subunit